MLSMDVYHISTTWIIALAALFTSLLIFKKWKNDKTSISFAWFWLTAVGVWLSTGSVVLFWLLGIPSASKVAGYLSFVFVVLEGPFLVYYLIKKLLNKEVVARIFFGIYILGSFVYLYFLFTRGLLGPYFSEWISIEFFEPPLAHQTIQILFIAPTLFLFCDFFKRIIGWVRAKRLKDGYLLVSDISLILYMGAGYFDLSVSVDWTLLMARIIVVLSVLMSYLAYFFGSRPLSKERLIHEV